MHGVDHHVDDGGGADHYSFMIVNISFCLVIEKSSADPCVCSKAVFAL